jgi:hypothetical protein
MQSRISIKSTFKLSKFQTLENRIKLLEENFKMLEERIVLPKTLYGFYSNIDMTVMFSVKFTMNINMKDRLLFMFLCPGMKR